MKAISIRQPWAGLILYDGKDVENRFWGSSYRGPLLIHASQQIDRSAMQELQERCFVSKGSPYFITGAIVGVCSVIDVTSVRSSEWHQKEMIGFYLQDVTAFESPIKYKGTLGLFNVPYEVVRRQIEQCGFQIKGDVKI